MSSGYTIEGQKTSEEKHGGLQLELIPAFQRNLRRWKRVPIECSSDLEFGSTTEDLENGLEEYKTPSESGLKCGDVVRSYENHHEGSEILVRRLFVSSSNAPWQVSIRRHIPE